MVDSAYFVKSTPLRAFTGSFQHFAYVLQTFWRCAWRSLTLKKIFLTNLQGLLLSHFSMTAPSNWWLIVYTLWNQLLLELSFDLFNTLKICYRHIEDVHEEVWCRKSIFWQTYRVFNLTIFSTFWRYFADMLKMCMKKFDAEFFFLTNSMQGVSSKSYLLPSFISIM